MSFKKWLKEDYKRIIFIAIYSSIIAYIGLFVSIVLMLVLSGIALVCCIIWIVILEYQIRKEEKEENYKQGL